MRTTAILRLLAFVTFFAISCKENEPRKEEFVRKDDAQSLKRLISLHPDSLMLVQQLIELYRDSGRYDSAIALTDQQISSDRGNAYLWNMKATLHFENNDTANALYSLEEAVNIYPLPEYLVALGTVYAEIKNKKALAIADTLMNANAMKYADDSYFIRGMYYSYNGDKNKAISFFDSALSKNFTYMYAYREKAIALYQLGKYHPAVTVLNRAVTVQNNFEEGHYWLGRCYEKLGMLGKAAESYQHALLYDKNFIEARHALQKLQTGINP